MVRVVESRSANPNLIAGLTRLELRTPDGTANSYLLAAAIIACGMDGVRRKLDTGPLSDVVKLKRGEWAAFSASVTDWEHRTYTELF